MKYSSLIMLLCLFALSGSGQKNESVLKILKKHTWVMQGMNGVKVTMSYKSNQQMNYWDGKPARPIEFYISNARDSVFDFKEKKGTKNGQYIITRMIRDKNDHRPRPISVLEIVEISNDKLVLKNESDVLIKFKTE